MKLPKKHRQPTSIGDAQKLFEGIATGKGKHLTLDQVRDSVPRRPVGRKRTLLVGQLTLDGDEVTPDTPGAKDWR